MPKFKNKINEKSGIPLGGLGTGTIEIRPDGHFYDWQLFNSGLWATDPFHHSVDAGPDLGTDGLNFYIRTESKGGNPVIRRLGMNSEQNDLIGLSWLKCVEEIEFNGSFPVAQLNYHDQSLPVSIKAEMFSPFIPHESRESGTPGFYASFRIKNTSESSIDISLLGIAKNPLSYFGDESKLHNSLIQNPEATIMSLKTNENSSDGKGSNSMAFSVTGGAVSYIEGEYSEYMKGYYSNKSECGSFHESVFHNFRKTGRLHSLPGNVSPSELLKLTDEEISKLTLAEKSELLNKFMDYPFAYDFISRYKEVVGNDMKNEAGIEKAMREIRFRLNILAGKDRQQKSWGDTALASTLCLGPNEEAEIVFALSWFFPNHISPDNNLIGHMYENWFNNAEDVVTYLTKNYKRLYDKTTLFKNTLYNTSLSEEMSEAWASQLATLTKSTWWTKNDEFAIWEGLGCCGFHTTDITYQGSFGLLALFPELQLKQMEMGARFQREDGFVHHLFFPDLSKVDNEFDRVDMNQQFVMLTCRDYVFTGNIDFAKRLWPNVVNAMNSLETLDGNGDGLPDQNTRRNTYDQWNLFGTPSYISSLWLSALLAGIRIAEDLGETAYAERWSELLEKGKKSFEAALWNGEYYSLWVDGEKRDECCMTDQIDGEWFTSVTGLGNCLPADRIKGALSAVMKYNFSEEDGLTNASYPPSSKPMFPTYRNFQAQAPWTGIEYLIASLLLEYEMTNDAIRIVKNIHDRYLRAGRFWNHTECGDHYYRALSSWSVLLSATGFKMDLIRETARFTPIDVEGEFKAPWFSSTGYGYFTQSESGFELTCIAGNLELRKLFLNVKSKSAVVLVNNEEIAASVSELASQTKKIFEYNFTDKINIKEGDILRV